MDCRISPPERSCLTPSEHTPCASIVLSSDSDEAFQVEAQDIIGIQIYIYIYVYIHIKNDIVCNTMIYSEVLSSNLWEV